MKNHALTTMKDCNIKPYEILVALCLCMSLDIDCHNCAVSNCSVFCFLFFYINKFTCQNCVFFLE